MTAEKRKRGRPRVMVPRSESMADFVSPDVKTDRGRQDVHYRMAALNVLRKDARFAWLADEAGMKAAILSELGRIEDAKELKAVARRICELKPKTKDAVTIIRRYRQGDPAGPYMKLSDHIKAALVEYLARHPSTPADWPVEVLRGLAEYIDACWARGKPP